MSNALQYLGIAKKAGLLETGEENTHLATKKGRAKLLIVASDSSENAKKRAMGYVWEGQLPITTVPYTKEEISSQTGRTGCSMAVILDAGIASSFASALFQEYGEQYSELAEDLKQRLEVEKRRKRSGVIKSAGKRRKKV